MSAAIGAGLDIAEPRGNLIVDIGGGTTDVAVISLGGIVVSESLRVGGDKFDEAIIRYVRKQFNLAIGEQTSEDLKVRIGTCFPQPGEELSMDIRGRDLVHGLPRQVTITSNDVAKAIEEAIATIINGIRRVMELTPPELAADIIDRGVILTGGGALLRGLPGPANLGQVQGGGHGALGDPKRRQKALGYQARIRYVRTIRPPLNPRPEGGFLCSEAFMRQHPRCWYRKRCWTSSATIWRTSTHRVSAPA